MPRRRRLVDTYKATPLPSMSRPLLRLTPACLSPIVRGVAGNQSRDSQGTKMSTGQCHGGFIPQELRFPSRAGAFARYSVPTGDQRLSLLCQYTQPCPLFVPVPGTILQAIQAPILPQTPCLSNGRASRHSVSDQSRDKLSDACEVAFRA